MDFSTTAPDIELDGAWSFAYSDDPQLISNYTTFDDLAHSGLSMHPCSVPGNFELDLQAIGEIEEPFYGSNIVGLTRYEHSHIWYTRRFHATARPGHDALLTFEGLDCYAEIFLNGKLLGTTDNMLIEHVFNVTEQLIGDNELVVHILPANVMAKQYPYPPQVAGWEHSYESLYVRKAPHMYGWDIMPRVVSAGIWRPVTLRYRPLERLEEVYLTTNRIADDNSTADLHFHYKVRTAGGAQDTYAMSITGECGESVLTESFPLYFDNGKADFSVKNPALWWPKGYGEANLYQVTVGLLKNGTEIDRFSFTLGIRTIELRRTSVAKFDGDGEFCFLVNGEKIFIRGTNWVPLDAYHSRDYSRIAAAVDLIDQAQCNAIRCWGGNVYEHDRFYELCDEKGILIWQDFTMACFVYPQDEDFCTRLATEVHKVVKRLRQHACIALWAGDNECDVAYAWNHKGNPNRNVLTRQIIPAVLREEDAERPYLPSSPCVDEEGYAIGEHFLPENHLWGPRNYFKTPFYKDSLCLFASEIGYHGCPAPESLRQFLTPERVWPYQNNEEWILHCTSPVPGVTHFDYRVELMAKQIRELFGAVPETVEGFAFASQATQAEADKFFIELFRGAKWRRTGIIWWNMIDGWPQLSDAVVDYYFRKKLAYEVITRVQQPVCVMLREPEAGHQQIVAANDTRESYPIHYTITDADSGEVVAQGDGVADANATTLLGSIPYADTHQRFYLIEWQSTAGTGRNHYLAGEPPFDLAQYDTWMRKAGLTYPATADVTA